MARPCFLVVDREFSSGISSRKLVIETAKFNVITAYSAKEATEMLTAFPAVNAAILDEHMADISCADLVAQLKQIKPTLPVVAIGTPGSCGPADYHVEPFSPTKLLELLQVLQPLETSSIRATNEELSVAEGDKE